MQRVRAGQVDQFNWMSRKHSGPKYTLDSDSREISCLLPEAGQSIEEGRLTAIRITYQRDAKAFRWLGRLT